MKSSTSVWLAICIALALFIQKVEPEAHWRVFLVLFFLGMIYLYGYTCRCEERERSATGKEEDAK